MRIVYAGGVAIFDKGLVAQSSRLILNLEKEVKASRIFWCQELQNNYLIR